MGKTVILISGSGDGDGGDDEFDRQDPKRQRGNSLNRPVAFMVLCRTTFKIPYVKAWQKTLQCMLEH